MTCGLGFQFRQQMQGKFGKGASGQLCTPQQLRSGHLGRPLLDRVFPSLWSVEKSIER